MDRLRTQFFNGMRICAAVFIGSGGLAGRQTPLRVGVAEVRLRHALARRREDTKAHKGDEDSSMPPLCLRAFVAICGRAVWSTMAALKMIVGLGNPGPQYAATGTTSAFRCVELLRPASRPAAG